MAAGADRGTGRAAEEEGMLFILNLLLEDAIY